MSKQGHLSNEFADVLNHMGAITWVITTCLFMSPAYAIVSGVEHPALRQADKFCSAAVGKKVIFYAGYSSDGLTRIEYNDQNEAVISVNENLLYRTPEAIVAFELFSACGRLINQSRQEPDRTFTSDCWAVQTLRNIGYWSRRDFETTVDWYFRGEAFSFGDGIKPEERAKNLYECAG